MKAKHFTDIKELTYFDLRAAIMRIDDWEMADEFDKIDLDLIIAAANANEEETYGHNEVK